MDYFINIDSNDERIEKTMLKLRRYVGQSIHIGEHVKVIFLEQKNGSLMIGIEAPKDIRILRTEIMNKPFKLKK
jgi:carbon storage regulator